MKKIPDYIRNFCKLLTIHGFEGRIVGGYIRDILSHLNQSEVDITTNALPDDVMKICQKYKIKCIPTGIHHGTVTVIMNQIPVEVTTLRRDDNCDGRHAHIIFTNDWREDAMRRDFTINSIYMDMNSRIYDYFDGQSDLSNGIVRFIGNPEARIHEDYLRILRYFRFLGCFENLNLHQDSFDASLGLSDCLNKLSRERVKSELFKILSCRFKTTTIQLMVSNSIFDKLGIPLKDVSVDNLLFCENAIINLAALFKNSQLYDITILKNLRLSNVEQKIIYNLLKIDFMNDFEQIVRGIIDDKSLNNILQKVINNYGKKESIELFKLYFILYMNNFNVKNPYHVLQKYVENINSIQPMIFPLNGNDMIALGYKNDEIGKKLKLAKRLWLESNCMLSKDLLITLLS